MEAGRMANSCKMWWGVEGDVLVGGDGSVAEHFF